MHPTVHLAERPTRGTLFLINFFQLYFRLCRSQWPRGLRRRSTAARLLRSWIRIPPGAWIFVCCDCCLLSGRGLCDELITRPEQSYRLWCVVVCDLENLKKEEDMTRAGSQRHRKKNTFLYMFRTNTLWLEPSSNHEVWATRHHNTCLKILYAACTEVTS